jgi:hypothetical protein
MKGRRELSAVLQFSLVLLFAGASWATMSITVTGSWFETIDESDLTGGAGSDLVSTYESAADQIGVGIGGTGNREWRVDIRKLDSVWHPDLGLSVRRTSDGSGSGWIAGGTSYQEVGDVYQEFFRGRRNRSGIDVQLMLDGVSVQVPCGSYLTTVYYTVIEVN